MMIFAGIYPFETTEVMRMDPLEDDMFEISVHGANDGRIQIAKSVPTSPPPRTGIRLDVRQLKL